MNGKNRISRMTALLLAVLMGVLACAAAGATEGKKTGMLASPMNPEFVLPSTLPPGYFAATDMESSLYVRDPEDTKIDGKWQKEIERPVVLEVERISGDIPEEETEGFLKVAEAEEGGKYFSLDINSLKTPGTAVFRFHIESEHYVLDEDYTLLARAFDAAEDALPSGRIKVGLAVGDKPYNIGLSDLGSATGFSCRGEPFTQPGVYEDMIRLTNHIKGFSCLRSVTYYVSKDGAWMGSGRTETVTNYAELLEAVNVNNTDSILISPNYNHGKNEYIEALELDWGRTVTISPADGRDSAVINGHVEIQGNGHVVFDRVDIEAPQGEMGLWVTAGADVTIGSVKGGDSAKENGGTAVFVHDARLTVASARGGNSVTGLAGDGVLAVGKAEVTVEEAVGGSSEQGVGGAGVIAVSGAQVTVNRSTAGGNGAAAPGRGVLTGEGSNVITAGEARDGETVEAKKKADPEIINSYAMLQNAIRSGKTEIVLDRKFTFRQTSNPMPLFSLGEGVIRITGPGNKAITVKDGVFHFCCGKWEVSGINLNSKSTHIALYSSGEGTEVTWNGNITVSNGNGVIATDHADLTLNGNVDHNSKMAVAVGAVNGARLRITGNVSEKGDRNAIYIDDSALVLTGNVSKAGSEAPAVYASGAGSVMITGNLSAPKCQAVCVRLGFVRLNGNLSGKPKKYPLLYAGDSGKVEINGTVPKGMAWYGTVLVNGEKPQ